MAIQSRALRLLAILVMAAFLSALCACGGGGDSGTDDDAAAGPSVPTPTVNCNAGGCI